MEKIFLDVDECKTGTHNCRYVCKNFHGGFKCICPEGFRRSAGGSCIGKCCKRLL